MKKVYMIHENTKPISIRVSYNSTPLKKINKNVQLATDFVCCVGYIYTEDEKDPNTVFDFEPIYDHDGVEDYPNLELNQYIPGLWFETYEEGCKVLTRILKARTENDANILATFNELAEKYPEALI